MTMWLQALFFCLLPTSILAAKGQGRDVRVINQSGFKVEIYWINRWKSDELVLNSADGVFHGSETRIKSYVTHEFEIVEVPATKTGLCRGEENVCRRGYFQVNTNDGQVVTFMTNLTTIEHVDNKSKARDQAADVIKECKAIHLTPNKSIDLDKLLECVETSVNSSLTKQDEEIAFQEAVRLKMGSKLANYACVDPKMKQTSEIENRTWTFTHDKKVRDVKVMMDRPNVQIHVIHDFISDAECDAVEKAVKLQRVNGSNGLWATKGGVDIPQNKPNDPLKILADKFYAYTDAQLLLSALDTKNAEQIFILKYTGNKEQDGSTRDRYEPHCDGACQGEFHKKGDRIATIIGYCEVPLIGGGTHFTNAGVHIVPKKGSAVFYSYIDPVRQTSDTGFTQHAGCPVIDGNKTIVTHKIRY